MAVAAVLGSVAGRRGDPAGQHLSIGADRRERSGRGRATEFRRILVTSGGRRLGLKGLSPESIGPAVDTHGECRWSCPGNGCRRGVTWWTNLTSSTPQAASPASYSRKVGERLRAIRRQKRLSLQEVEAASRRSSRRRCSAPTSGASGPSRCPGSSAWPASTTCRSTSCCPRDDGPSFAPADGRRPHRAAPEPAAQDHASTSRRLDELDGPEAEMLTRYLRDDPGAAPGLQRPGAHHPPRRPAGHRLHPRRHRRRRRPSRLDELGLAASSALSRPPAAVRRGRDRPFGVYVHVPFCRAALRLLRLRHLDRPRTT